MDCVFCKIAAGQLPAHTLYEDERVLAFLDIQPGCEGHSLVIPKAHAENFFTLEDADRDAVFAAARRVVLHLWGPRIAAVEPDARDAKTSLQEIAQASGQQPPTYREEARAGPDHQPVFTVSVTLESGETETARAGSKRQAEQAAARALLARMNKTDG